MTNTTSDILIKKTETFGAHNYHPLPIVVAEAEGVWVTDPEGNKYMDMLSAYSALNQGHRHPKIIGALIDQLDKDGILDNSVLVIYGDHTGIHKYYNDELEKIEPKESWWNTGYWLPTWSPSGSRRRPTSGGPSSTAE